MNDLRRGTTHRPILTIGTFYETDGPIMVGRTPNVDKLAAEKAFYGAAHYVGRYTGPIAIAAVRGLTIPSASPLLKLETLRPPTSEPHVMLITGRMVTINIPGEGHLWGESATVPHYRGIENVGTVTAIENPPTLANIQGSRLLALTTRAMARGFGVPSCAQTETACLLQPELNVTTSGAVSALFTNPGGEPFCGPCIKGLEFAGYQARSVQMDGGPGSAI